MLVKFKQAVRLGGQDYKLNSVHEVTPELALNSFFKKMVQAGLVIEGEVVRKATPKDEQAKQEKLAAKLQKLEPIPAPPADEIPPGSPVDESLLGKGDEASKDASESDDLKGQEAEESEDQFEDLEADEAEEVVEEESEKKAVKKSKKSKSKSKR